MQLVYMCSSPPGCINAPTLRNVNDLSHGQLNFVEEIPSSLVLGLQDVYSEYLGLSTRPPPFHQQPTKPSKPDSYVLQQG